MFTPSLQLERSFFTQVEIEADPKHVLGQGQVEVTTTQALGPAAEKGSLWVVELDLSVAGKERSSAPPYRIHLHSVGTFSFPRTAMADVEKAHLLAVTGVSILYSQAREYILMLTARGPWGPFQLPTVSFIDNEPDREERSALGVREPAADCKPESARRGGAARKGTHGGRVGAAKDR